MRVYCKICGLVLTQDIVRYSGKNFGEADAENYIPSGYYTISDSEYFHESLGAIIINITDLINCENHKERGRLNGCCGLDGCDGPNKICLNGHEVATEKSDCWMPHAVLFEKDKIILK